MSDEHEIRSAAHARWKARGCPEGDSWQDWFAAERKVDRHFYHSFPRSDRGADTEIPTGLSILRQIVQHGFLLTPETHEIRQEFQNPHRAVTAWLVQQRFCLTELNAAELPWHASEFGSFALEFDISAARSIGAMPVLYFNRSTPDEGGTWYLARMLTHLSYIREQLLWRIIDLKNGVLGAGSNPNAPIKIANGVTISAFEAAAFLDFLGVSGDFDPHQLEASIRLSSCLWSPTENLRYNSLLGYYKQREWRIVPGPERTGLKFADLSDVQKEQLLELNPQFFSGEFQIEPKKTARRIDACKVLKDVDSRHILSQVRRIIAPRAALKDAEQVVAPLNLNLSFAAIEDLW